jgi:hypothetical protein
LQILMPVDSTMGSKHAKGSHKVAAPKRTLGSTNILYIIYNIRRAKAGRGGSMHWQAWAS